MTPRATCPVSKGASPTLTQCPRALDGGKHNHLTYNRSRILYNSDIIPEVGKNWFLGKREKKQQNSSLLVCGLSSGHMTHTDILYIHGSKMSQGKGSFRKRKYLGKLLKGAIKKKSLRDMCIDGK